MLVIPLQAVQAQSLSVQLNNQNVQMVIAQKFYGVFVDVYLDNTLVIGGVLALNNVRIVRDPYLGFVGDLAFTDTEGVPNITPCTFVGSIAGTTLTVTSIISGVISTSQRIDDNTGVLAVGTGILTQLTGPAGGVGTYTVNIPQTIYSETMFNVMTGTALNPYWIGLGSRYQLYYFFPSELA